MQVFDRFVEIIARLRSPDGCPWDREQTHHSLIPYCIEEAYEVVDAIQENDMSELKNELGDLLLQILLHSQIASEEKKFSIEDVVESISEKMIRRHPHVFSDVKLNSSQEVVDQWSELKKKEGKKHTLDGIPKHAPQLFRSQKIGDKVSSLGFDWENEKDVWKKVEEEIKELHSTKNEKETEEELGDLLFSLVQWSRHQGIDAEKCLQRANEKFSKRFSTMEDLISNDQQAVKKLTAPQWESYWLKAKTVLAK